MSKSERHITFTFKSFSVDDTHCAMKVGTDGVVLGAWTHIGDARFIVDIGAGCGLIGLMLAQRSKAHVTALEIDESACHDAAANFIASPWTDRLTIKNDSFDDFRPLQVPDLIVSNPPFFADGEHSPVNSRANARHEGSLNYVSLIDYAATYLSGDGRLSFIYPYGREDEIIYKAEMSHLKLRRICHLRQNPARPLIRTMYEFSRTDGPIEAQELIIRELSGGYTTDFTRLCKDFYLEL